MSFNYSPKIVNDGLILYIDTINNSCITSGDTNYNDLSKSNNNGNLINGALYDTEFLPNIKTDGINDYINCGNLTKELFKNNQYTVDVWMKIVGADRGDIFNIKEFISLPFNIRHDIGLTILDGSSNKIRLWTRVDTILDNLPITTAEAPRNTVFNFSVTVNTNGLVSMYFNGELDNNSTTLNSNLIDITDDVGSDFWIFANRSDLTTPSFPLNGNLYNFKLYNKCLTNNEIKQNYNTLKTRFGL